MVTVLARRLYDVFVRPPYGWPSRDTETFNKPPRSFEVTIHATTAKHIVDNVI